MREVEQRVGGQQWGMFQIFEPAEITTTRFIDQSVAAWRLASRKLGSAAFENPRSVIQRTVSMVTGGSNNVNRAQITRVRPTLPYDPAELERVPMVFHRPMRPLTLGEVARMCSERYTAEEVRLMMQNVTVASEMLERIRRQCGVEGVAPRAD